MMNDLHKRRQQEMQMLQEQQNARRANMMRPRVDMGPSYLGSITQQAMGSVLDPVLSTAINYATGNKQTENVFRWGDNTKLSSSERTSIEGNWDELDENQRRALTNEYGFSVERREVPLSQAMKQAVNIPGVFNSLSFEEGGKVPPVPDMGDIPNPVKQKIGSDVNQRISVLTKQLFAGNLSLVDFANALLEMGVPEEDIKAIVMDLQQTMMKSQYGSVPSAALS